MQADCFARARNDKLIIFTMDPIQLSITTPALLFSAVSLILLAYTNRFMGYAQIIRNLYAEFKKNKDYVLVDQINNLRKRLYLIRAMQILGVLSLLLSMGSMLFLYFNFNLIGASFFAVSLVCMIASLAISIWEIQISVKALDMHLHDIQKEV